MARIKKNYKKNIRKSKNGNRYIFKITTVTRAEQATLAGEYYDKHKQTIDNAINDRIKKEGSMGFGNKTNRELFIEAAIDSSVMTVVNYGSKKSAKRALAGLVDDIRGLDPNIKQIKKEAEGREQAGFKDLRKLNRKVNGAEIDYIYGDVVGYFEISGSDYVIAHSRTDRYNTGSPIDVYEYVLKSSIGL